MTKTNVAKAKWTHRVVKRARGHQGKWFDFPTAATFSSEADARAYAEALAAEQTGVHGAVIDVRSRKGTCAFGRGALVASYHILSK
jgi:hypothetical protein